MDSLFFQLKPNSSTNVKNKIALLFFKDEEFLGTLHLPEKHGNLTQSYHSQRYGELMCKVNLTNVLKKFKGTNVIRFLISADNHFIFTTDFIDSNLDITTINVKHMACKEYGFTNGKFSSSFNSFIPLELYFKDFPKSLIDNESIILKTQGDWTFALANEFESHWIDVDEDHYIAFLKENPYVKKPPVFQEYHLKLSKLQDEKIKLLKIELKEELGLLKNEEEKQKEMLLKNIELLEKETNALLKTISLTFERIYELDFHIDLIENISEKMENLSYSLEKIEERQIEND